MLSRRQASALAWGPFVVVVIAAVVSDYFGWHSPWIPVGGIVLTVTCFIFLLHDMKRRDKEVEKQSTGTSVTLESLQFESGENIPTEEELVEAFEHGEPVQVAFGCSFCHREWPDGTQIAGFVIEKLNDVGGVRTGELHRATCFDCAADRNDVHYLRGREP